MERTLGNVENVNASSSDITEHFLLWGHNWYTLSCSKQTPRPTTLHCSCFMFRNMIHE